MPFYHIYPARKSERKLARATSDIQQIQFEYFSTQLSCSYHHVFPVTDTKEKSENLF